MMHWFYGGFPFFMAGWHFFGVFLFIVFIIFLIVLATRGSHMGCGRHFYRHYHSDDSSYKEEDEALRIVRNLYAEGKISEEEFERRKRNLEK